MTRGPGTGRPAAALLAAALLLAACSYGGAVAVRSAASPPASPGPLATSEAPVHLPKGPADGNLCGFSSIPTASPPPVASAGPLPPAIQAVADQTASVRGLAFRRPVSPESVTKEQIADQLHQLVEQYLPLDFEARRGAAWVTMGALPPGTDLAQALLAYYSTQVIGYYDTISHRLVFIGADSPSPYQRMTLSHELTHALDDQYFDLSQEDRLQASCKDEPLDALAALAEGDAVETSIRWARANLSAAELIDLQQEAGSFPQPPGSIPPFVESLQVFPYPNGQRFVQALVARGGQAALDAAFRNPPVSTEQILHPEKYPSETPVAIEVADLASALGPAWSATDVMEVGEEFLRAYLGLRLPAADAEAGADGWAGGQYRAWSDGTHEAVELDTVWDSEADAQGFADAMGRWLAAEAEAGAGAGAGAVRAVPFLSGTHVTVAFASDPQTLDLLRPLAA